MAENAASGFYAKPSLNGAQGRSIVQALPCILLLALASQRLLKTSVKSGKLQDHIPSHILHEPRPVVFFSEYHVSTNTIVASGLPESLTVQIL